MNHYIYNSLSNEPYIENNPITKSFTNAADPSAQCNPFRATCEIPSLFLLPRKKTRVLSNL